MSKIETVYLIHHSHTDVGYTHDQPILWDLYQRFIDEALDLAEQYAGSDSDGAFRWTVENTAPLMRWLQNASPADVDRLVALERAGRVEVTGMFANLTPLFDSDQLLESFQVLRRLRGDYGFDIRHAMNCDVNGENWPLVDLLLDLGIEGFTMAINTHFGGVPLPRPQGFWWQGPSGRKLLAWNGWTYDTGWRYGIGRSADELAETWWPRVERYLDETGYPLPVIMLQSFHPFGDNGSAFGEFSRFIDEWNGRGRAPHLVMATPRMWWAAVAEHSHLLPTIRGDWTDYWNFGCISSAREQAINRASRARLRSADALAAVVPLPGEEGQGVWTHKSFARYREDAWRSLHLWDEHTWGAEISIRLPASEDVSAQWHHKAHTAYQARSLSLMLQRDALADFARLVDREAADDLLLFNPLPWSRQLSGEVPIGVLSPRGVPEDTTAGRQFQDRFTGESQLLTALDDQAVRQQLQVRALPPTMVPGYGYTVVKRASLIDLMAEATISEESEVENGRFRLVFDRQKGGILSWYDKPLEQEWVDDSAGYPLHGFVHESVADKNHEWPRRLMFHMEWQSDQVERPFGWKPGWPAERQGPTAVLDHRVIRYPLGIRVVQRLQASGCQGTLVQSVFLPDSADFIECESWWQMDLDAHPQATYLLFPFHVPGAAVHLDVGGVAIRPGADQIPGTCRDYYTAQGWVDFNNGECGVTVALPDNPMVELGDFHFGDKQDVFKLERAMLLGWVTNNYWETNFRAHQPGRVHARYRLQPYQGEYDEGRAHRFGLEAAYAAPLLQQLGEAPADGALLPSEGSVLKLPGREDEEAAVLTLHVKRAADGPGVIVRLLNTSDQTQETTISSGLWRITAAQKCDLLEEPRQMLDVTAGEVHLGLLPRRITTVLLQVTREVSN